MNAMSDSGNKTFLGLIAAWAADSPDSVYLQHVDGSQRTVGEVLQRSLQWAAYWRSLGVKPRDFVMIMDAPSIEGLERWLGLGWLSAIEVPVNTAYKGHILKHVVDNCGAKVLMVGEEYVDRFVASEEFSLGSVGTVLVSGRLPSVDLEAAIIPESEWNSGVDTAEPLEVVAEPTNDLQCAIPSDFDIACVLYTSGTTGPSKGVLVPWGQLHVTATGTIPLEYLDDKDAFYVPYPLFHISGKYPLVLMAVTRGRVVLRDRFSTSAFWHDVSAFGCTTTLLMEAMAHFLTREPATDRDADTPLRNVQITPMYEGAGEFGRRFGLRVCSVYNMSEISCPINTGATLVNDASCGRVRDGYDARLVDENDREVAVGEVGELIVRASRPHTMMAGYLNNDRATVEAWRNLWFHTGDGFRQDAEGNFYFVDRLKDAIRRRGENISSIELELEVGAHAGVRECAAVAVKSEWGEDDVKVFVVPDPGYTVTAPDLVAFLAERVPAFMVPRFIEFVDEIPRTATGKIRKVELRSAGHGDRMWDAEDAR